MRLNRLTARAAALALWAGVGALAVHKIWSMEGGITSQLRLTNTILAALAASPLLFRSWRWAGERPAPSRRRGRREERGRQAEAPEREKPQCYDAEKDFEHEIEEVKASEVTSDSREDKTESASEAQRGEGVMISYAEITNRGQLSFNAPPEFRAVSGKSTLSLYRKDGRYYIAPSAHWQGRALPGEAVVNEGLRFIFNLCPEPKGGQYAMRGIEAASVEVIEDGYRLTKKGEIHFEKM